jgi:hypothetical protein
MAVKESTKTPEVKKFTEEELKSLQTLQQKIQQSTFQFGQLYLSKIKLEEQEKTLKDYVYSLEQEEVKLAETLNAKYGKGSIDTLTGEFTPSKE